MEQLRQTITLYARSRAAAGADSGETGGPEKALAARASQAFFHPPASPISHPLSLCLAVNCGAIMSRCWKAELFGYEEGRVYRFCDEEAGRGCLKSHTAARCFWMKSAKCLPCPYKPDFCAYWRKKPSLASADTSHVRWMSGDPALRIAIWIGRYGTFSLRLFYHLVFCV